MIIVLSVIMKTVAFESQLNQFQKVIRYLNNIEGLKSDSHLPKKCYFICFIGSPLKIMKNAFYFILILDHLLSPLLLEILGSMCIAIVC